MSLRTVIFQTDELTKELNQLQRIPGSSKEAFLESMIGVIQKYVPEANHDREWFYVKDNTLCCASDIIKNMSDIKKENPTVQMKKLIPILLARYQDPTCLAKFVSNEIENCFREICSR